MVKVKSFASISTVCLLACLQECGVGWIQLGVALNLGRKSIYRAFILFLTNIYICIRAFRVLYKEKDKRSSLKGSWMIGSKMDGMMEDIYIHTQYVCVLEVWPSYSGTAEMSHIPALRKDSCTDAFACRLCSVQRRHFWNGMGAIFLIVHDSNANFHHKCLS